MYICFCFEKKQFLFCEIKEMLSEIHNLYKNHSLTLLYFHRVNQTLTVVCKNIFVIVLSTSFSYKTIKISLLNPTEPRSRFRQKADSFFTLF